MSLESWDKQAEVKNAEILHKNPNAPTWREMALVDYRTKATKSRRRNDRNFINQQQLKTNVFLRDDFTCFYCNFYMKDLYISWLNGEISRSEALLTVDHILPRSLGGELVMENLVTCCFVCNKEKGQKLHYAAQVKFYRQRPKVVPWPLAVLSMWCEWMGQRWLRAASYLRTSK